MDIWVNPGSSFCSFIEKAMIQDIFIGTNVLCVPEEKQINVSHPEKH
jgi:hypothetical protein